MKKYVMNTVLYTTHMSFISPEKNSLKIDNTKINSDNIVNSHHTHYKIDDVASDS